ncbi:MAG: hypothetical protein QOJ54_711 [Aliidongia sp.]|nr:hypothetical protein [Aliidongia sp.]
MIAADAIAGLISSILFLVIFYGPWQRLCADLARHQIFKRRDVIFDMARAGVLDFNSPSYRTIRDTLNAEIRFAHAATCWRLVWFWVFGMRVVKPGGAEKIGIAISSIKDSETRDKVNQCMEDAIGDLLDMMFRRSLLLLFLALCSAVIAIPVLWVCWAIGQSRRGLRSRIRGRLVESSRRAILAEARADESLELVTA